MFHHLLFIGFFSSTATLCSLTHSAPGLTCPSLTPLNGSCDLCAVLSLPLRSPGVETGQGLGPLPTCSGSSLPLILMLRTAPSFTSWAIPSFTKCSPQGVRMSWERSFDSGCLHILPARQALVLTLVLT